MDKKSRGEKFGLGILPQSASNEIRFSDVFTRKDFITDLKKACKPVKSSPKQSKT